MPESSAHKAFAASTLALILALVCIAQFLPPFAAQTLASTPRTVFTAVALGLSAMLHWVCLGLGARRAGHSVGFWVFGMAVLLFPIGGAAALLLLRWAHTGPATQAAAHRPA